MKLNERLKLERESQGMSVRELARRAGLSSAHLLRIERGACQSPSFEYVVKIATVLGVDLDKLVDEISPDIEKTKEDFRRLVDFSEVSGIHRKRLLEVNDVVLMKGVLSLKSFENMMRVMIENCLRVVRVKAEKRISREGNVKQKWIVEVEVIGEEAYYYQHRFSRIEVRSGRQYENFSITKCKVAMNKKVTEVEPKILVNQPDFVYNKIPFPSALTRGQKAVLNWEDSYDRGHIMSKKQLEGGEAFKERSAFLQLYSPTEELIKTLLFPKGFDNRNIFFPYAVVAKTRRKDDEETKRLVKEGCLRRRKVNGKPVVTLKVKRLKPRTWYYIGWQIPE